MNKKEITARICANWKLKVFLSLVLNSMFAVLYLVPQHFPVFTITEITPSAFDRIIPFLPVFVFLYESLYFLMPIAPWLMKRKNELNQYSLGIIVMTVVGFVFFFFSPSCIARPEYLENSNFLYDLLIQLDKPLNAFPSLHVSFAVFHAGWCWRIFSDSEKQHRYFRMFLWIWALGIIISTLFIKQHMLIDVLGGGFLGFAAFAFCCRQSKLSFNSFFSKIFPSPLLETGKLDENLFVIKDGLVNCFVVKYNKGLICIDTGWRSSCIKRNFEELNLDIKNVTDVFVTHLHWDHCRCFKLFKNANLFISKKEDPAIIHKLIKSRKPLHLLINKMGIKRGCIDLEVIGTPGHTASSLSFLLNEKNQAGKSVRKFLFTGDTVKLLQGKAMLPTFFNENQELLEASIRKLADQKNVTYLLTSHYGMSDNFEEAFAALRKEGKG